MAKNTQKSAAPTGPNNRSDWDAYARRLGESVVAAEQHLEIPVGTISSIPNDPDFIATVKAYAVVEPLLNDLIATWPPKSFVLGLTPSLPHENETFRNFVTVLPMSGNTGKLKLAGGLRLLSSDDVSFIRALATVRNRYAHNVRNMHRSLAEMLNEERENNGKIVEHLTGLRDEQQGRLAAVAKLSQSDANSILKILMYYQLAGYLARALNTLHPPPPPTGGILGPFFEKGPTGELTSGNND